MSDRNSDPDNEKTTAVPAAETPPKRPLWVKVAGIIVVVLVLLFLILKLMGAGGDHGPGRHVGYGQSPSSIVTGRGTAPGIAYSFG